MVNEKHCCKGYFATMGEHLAIKSNVARGEYCNNGEHCDNRENCGHGKHCCSGKHCSSGSIALLQQTIKNNVAMGGVGEGI